MSTLGFVGRRTHAKAGFLRHPRLFEQACRFVFVEYERHVDNPEDRDPDEEERREDGRPVRRDGAGP